MRHTRRATLATLVALLLLLLLSAQYTLLLRLAPYAVEFIYLLTLHYANRLCDAAQAHPWATTVLFVVACGVVVRWRTVKL